MKELSIEEKAKAYDEAIKRAKELLEIGVKDTRDKMVVLSFFPELKESEGERIRKELIDFINSHLAGFPQCEKYIAWIERQGEQKTVDKVEPIFSWKPTEKQINAIRVARSFVTDDFGENPTLSETLKELEEQLRNL